MTYEEVSKYMALGEPCDLEKRAHYLLLTLRDGSIVFNTFWDSLEDNTRDYIFEIIVEELEDFTAIN